MPVVIACPACHQKARVPDAMLGQSVRCPACAATFAVPADGAPAPSEPPTDPPVVATAEPEVTPARQPTRPPLPADADALRAVRAGVGVQLWAHAAYAVALALFVLLVMAGVAGALGGGGGGHLAAVLPMLLGLAGVLLLTVGSLLSLVGGSFCVLAPPAYQARGLAVAALLLTALTVERTVTVIGWAPLVDEAPWRGPGGGLWTFGMVSLALVWMFESARLAVLALFWRAVSRILRDGRGATTAYRLAVTGPVLQVALAAVWLLLGLLADMDRELLFVGLVGWLAIQAVVVLWGLVVLARLRRRLRAAVPP